jgi:thiamine pyrophosphate-dependent acetolactate synthase large subunit-like protein
MTTISGAEAMVRLLQLHGVQHIFGLCGDTSLPFYTYCICRRNCFVSKQLRI